MSAPTTKKPAKSTTNKPSKKPYELRINGKKYELPNAETVINKIAPSTFRYAMANPRNTMAQVSLAFAAFEAAGLDDETLEAIESLGIEGMSTEIMNWFNAVDAKGVAPGESSSSVS